MDVYSFLIRLYPGDVRFAYGEEMVDALRRDHARCRELGVPRLAMFVSWTVITTLVDVAAERVNALYSHRSFHGRGKPDSGVVRPPNMGKRECFDSQEGGSTSTIAGR